MHAPSRLMYAFRPRASPGVLAAAAAVAALFAATPFLIPEVSARYGVALGVAGLISTAQVGGFALASFLAGRVLRPQPGLLTGSTLALAFFNLASVIAPGFASLVILRALAGICAGLITWIAWADAARHQGGLGDVAATGPVAAALASPLFGWLSGIADDRLVYGSLVVLTLLVLPAPVRLEPGSPVGRSVGRSRSNQVLLLALMLLTLSGSSMFVYAAAAGRTLAGLSPLAVSLGFSINAVAGIVATRLRPGRLATGPWLALTGVSALVVGHAGSGLLYTAAMAIWGFAFWLGVPEVFRLLAARSRTPAERMGDAQALMAVGRALGPAVGGLLVGPGRFGLLGFGAGAGLAAGAALVTAVEVRRRRVSRTASHDLDG